jgi:histo-blood group ABO system transferase
MKICILTIATNRYLRFVEPLRASIARHFLLGHEIRQLLFTNHAVESSQTLRTHRIAHEPWPLPTLRRYEHFLTEKEFILDHDYCFYMDADMRVDGPVGDEILGDIVAVRHPYQSFLQVTKMTYERNPRSLAYVPVGQGTTYYAGGFHGGRTAAFMEMAEVLAARIRGDTGRGIVAVWHDESHLNRYLVDHPPSVSLSPAYCFPEEWYHTGQPHAGDALEPMIVALRKNHKAVRRNLVLSVASAPVEQTLSDRSGKHGEPAIAEPGDPIRRWIETTVPVATREQHCLEIGCERTRYLAVLGRHGYVVHGVDSSPAVERMPEAFRAMQICTGDFTQCDWMTWSPPRQYDVVCSFCFLQRFVDWPWLLEKHAALVAPGGLLLIETPNVAGMLQRRLHGLLDGLEIDHHHRGAMDSRGWARVLDRLGWEVVSHGPLGRFDFSPESSPDGLRGRVGRGLVGLARPFLRLLPPSRAASPSITLVARRRM